MKISELFTKDITRSINGVIKVDQQDAQSIWQELDEFVITKELRRHFDRFFSTYAESVDRPNDPDIAGKMGIWVSGFFGSGKSHFIKALSYLFRDKEITYICSSTCYWDMLQEVLEKMAQYRDGKGTDRRTGRLYSWSCN